MTYTPRPFQRHDLDLLKRENYRGLLNMEMGSGKTVTGVFSHIESGSNVTLAIAPEQTHGSAWLPTLAAMGIEGRVIGNGGKAQKQAMSDLRLQFPGFYLVTPQLFTRADASDWAGDLLIADESHGLMNPGSKGQRKLSGFTPAEARVALSTRFDGRMSLSGTALRNNFRLAWSQARLIWPHLDRAGEIGNLNHWSWLNERMAYREIYTSQRDRDGNAKKVKDYYGEKIPGQWVNEAPLVITHYKRRECCQFHPEGFLDLEEPTVVHETITLAPAQKKAVRELENHMLTYLGDNPLVVDLPLTKATRIRQMVLGVPTVSYDEDDKAVVEFAPDCQSPYMDYVESFLRDETDEPVIIFTSSQRFAAVTVARLNDAGIPSFEFSGATRKTRTEDMKQFGKKYRVLVAVIAAISEGFDGAQHVTSTEIWLDTALDETLNEQGRSRTDRWGQTKRVLRVMLHDDLGLSHGRYSEAIQRRLELNKSLRRIA